MHPEEMEKRSRTVNTKGITDEAYREQAYGMLRKRKNPKPNGMDKLMFEAYTRIGIYLPITAFVSDFCPILTSPRMSPVTSCSTPFSVSDNKINSLVCRFRFCRGLAQFHAAYK